MRRSPLRPSRTPISRSAPLPPRRQRIDRGAAPKPRNARRRARETPRAFGPAERRQWIQAQPSVVSGKTPCVNAHVKSGGGSRRADARWIVPLTDQEHHELHDGIRTFEARYGVDLAALAVETERRWQQHVAALAGRGTPPQEGVDR